MGIQITIVRDTAAEIKADITAFASLFALDTSAYALSTANGTLSTAVIFEPVDGAAQPVPSVEVPATVVTPAETAAPAPATTKPAKPPKVSAQRQAQLDNLEEMKKTRAAEEAAAAANLASAAAADAKVIADTVAPADEVQKDANELGRTLTAAEASKLLGKTALVSAPTETAATEEDPLAEEAGDPMAEDSPVATYEQISELFLAMRKNAAIGVKGMIALTTEFGIKKLVELKPEQYVAMAKRANAVLAAANK